MSHMKFGQTWWGRKWIEALESIDEDTNRLPRGKTYARTGAVREIKVNKKEILAKVQGSRKSPYTIKINLDTYNSTEKKRIENLLRENPGIFGEFSVGKITEDTEKFFTKNKIKLFPASWEEIHATCSCPDWANPCKHRAAVYYLLANEIDKNPFLLLEWRGVETKKITGKIDKMSKEEDSVYFLEPSDYSPPNYPEEFHIDLQFPKMEIKYLFDSLDDNPVFYPNSNFKNILKKNFKLISDSLDSLEIKEEYPTYLKQTNFYFVFPATEKEFRIFVDNELFIKSVLNKKYKLDEISLPHQDGKGRVFFQKKKGLYFSVFEIVQFFSSIPLMVDNSYCTPSGRFLSLLVSLSASILQSQSFFPGIEWKNSTEFSISYSPIFVSDKSRTAFQEFEKYFDPAFGIQLDTSFLVAFPSMQLVFKKFLDAYFRYLFDLKNIEILDKIQTVFFGVHSGFVPEDFTEEQVGKSIENWLERVSSIGYEVSPLIQININSKDRFELQLFLEKKNDPVAVPIPAHEVLSGKNRKILGESSAEVKLKMIRQILSVTERIKELYVILNSRGERKVEVGLERIANIILKEKPALEFLGIRFFIPKDLKHLLKAQLSYEAKSVRTINYITMQDMLNFKAKILVDGKEITDKELKYLVDNAGKLIPFREGYILLDPKEAERLFQESKSPRKPSKMEMLFALMTGVFNGEELKMDKNFSNFVEDLKKIENVSLPIGLKAELRPYQKTGFEWMYSNLQKGIGPCIADDMGLGKTLQVIAVLLKLKEEGKLKKQALVICPTSLLGNWKKEIERFAPSLTSVIFHGTKKLLSSDADVWITTYAHARISQKYFSKRPWDIVIVDEAQFIKNPLTEQAKAIKAIPANNKIAMSGTPVENRLTELWSIFDFINPDFLGSLNSFKKEIAIPIERYRDELKIHKLKTATSPFIIRRLKTDKSIIADLPEKIIMNEYPPLTKEQEAIYSEHLKKMLELIEENEGMARKGLILKLITDLKQICNHPSQFSKKANYDPELSGKSIALMEILEKIIAKNEKVLLFTQYTQMGKILQKMISKTLAESADFFEGQLTRQQREKLIDKFYADPDCKILIISLRAGGTGLNLVNASNVIHYDLWWNPAVEEQATDRAFRIGQKKNVQVYRFVTLGTFEEKIDDIMKQKRELANLTVAEGEKWITEMSNKELADLFGLKNSSHV